MAVTPLVSTHRATFAFTCDGLEHKHQVLCSAHASGTLSGFAFSTYDATTLDVDTGAQAYWSLVAALLPSSAVQGAWVLEAYVSGAYVPVYSAALVAVPSGTGSRSEANRFTTTFRDQNNKKVRSVILGTNIVVPIRGSTASAGGTLAAYIIGLLTPTTTNPGNWVTGRSGARFTAGLYFTGSLDRKSRRRLGLV